MAIIRPGQGTDLSNPAKQNDWALQNGYQGWTDYQSKVREDAQNSDPINIARRAQQMQIEANQPAIQTLNTQKTTLDSKYDDLLKSITGSEGVALDKTTLATSNELGRRGITSDSGLYQKEQAGAALPVTTQFGQLKANTGVQREQDLTGLAERIAELQAGNVPNSLNFGNGVVSLRQQAEQIANNLALGQESNAIQRASITKPTQRYYDVSAGGLYDSLNDRVIQGLQSLRNNVNNGGGF